MMMFQLTTEAGAAKETEVEPDAVQSSSRVYQ